MTGELTISHTSTVTEDQIDHLGHMNVRWYFANARAATRQVLASLGHPDVATADLYDMYTRHHREQMLGNRLEVRSGIVGVDGTSIRMYHELANADTGDLAATFVFRVRSATPVDATPADAVEVVEIPEHGAPRSIDVDAEPATPSLERLRELGLEMRRERTIGPEDTEGADTVPAHLVPMLLWGGTALDGDEVELVRTGPDGTRLGWVTMETRIVTHRLPEIGTRIQSFTATTAMGDKVNQRSMWAHDLDRGDLLVSFELVSLMFDLDARRARSIPEGFGDETVHPEFASRRPD